jgi:hypothetical protein
VPAWASWATIFPPASCTASGHELQAVDQVILVYAHLQGTCLAFGQHIGMPGNNQAHPALCQRVTVSISREVTAPSSAAIPSQVADRTNRLASVMLLICVMSNKSVICFPFHLIGFLVNLILLKHLRLQIKGSFFQRHTIGVSHRVPAVLWFLSGCVCQQRTGYQ